MARKDRTAARVGKVILYRRDGATIFAKWYNPDRGGRGNYQRKSLKTTDLREALRKAADLADALDAGLPEPERAALGPTIMEAATRHPATKRERDAYPNDHRRHLAAVQDHVRFSRSDMLRDLDVGKVADWLRDLEKRGKAFDTRRHALVPLRRASAMAPSFDLPDVLNKMRLDRRTEALEVEALDLDELRRLLAHARSSEDGRWAAAVGLMGLMGLRPSEAVRLRAGDLKDGMLHVGANGAKTGASDRVLPVPQIVMEILAPLVEGRDGGEPLLGLKGTEASASSILSRSVKAVVERAGSDIPAKALRKSFATVLLNELGAEAAMVEAFLGHKHPAALNVTRRHYLKRAGAKSLRPLAATIDAAFK